MLRATGIRHDRDKDRGNFTSLLGTAVLEHDERHLRRKVINLTNGLKVLVDLAEPVVLVAGDELLLDDGSTVCVEVAEEQLYAVSANNQMQLTEFAWHIGNRHLPAAILRDRILIPRDHVVKAMLERLGAVVDEIVAPFDPVPGAYHGGGHAHDHDIAHPHHHENS
ncbi:urease accessory protein UreE [Phyllobacterium bourgognense]|uniref:Urease accessory protein UreE n=1 Tax=Phyllobacterium bourgognense TaxID=314236 RepID=A0A368YQ79_9HYPH|nr:urease accessory protein UreE [Phyllobacterium bourgognense]RCW82380.1 urease accessory protein [Phyllobacterium bourgognense]